MSMMMRVSENGSTPNSWIVYFLENPNLKWMITGAPYTPMNNGKIMKLPIKFWAALFSDTPIFFWKCPEVGLVWKWVFWHRMAIFHGETDSEPMIFLSRGDFQTPIWCWTMHPQNRIHIGCWTSHLGSICLRHSNTQWDSAGPITCPPCWPSVWVRTYQSKCEEDWIYLKIRYTRVITCKFHEIPWLFRQHMITIIKIHLRTIWPAQRPTQNGLCRVHAPPVVNPGEKREFLPPMSCKPGDGLSCLLPCPIDCYIYI